MTTYADDMTLRDARARYFEANGFGADGGYGKKWEVIKLGPVPIPIRNVPARVAAIRFHDLHHIVTGYDTSLVGEAEIGAWEIASGCADKWFAWGINLQALLLGLFVGPRALYAAFVRGRYSNSLYAERYDDALLEQTVGEAKRRLKLDRPAPTASGSDTWAFAGWIGGALSLHLAPVVVLAYLTWWLWS